MSFPAMVAAERTGAKRPGPPRGLLVHVTGRGILKHADPQARAIELYSRGKVFPDALIGYEDVFTFTASDLVRTAHAAWRPWERRTYLQDWATWRANRRRPLWARDHRDATVRVPTAFYDDWFDRWQGDGRFYRNPVEIVEKVGGPRAYPNSTYYGVEILSSPDGRVTDAQHELLAALFVAKSREHGWFDPADIVFEMLPQPWLCGHDDINPARRWRRVKGEQCGEGWDPGDGIDWEFLGMRIEAEATL